MANMMNLILAMRRAYWWLLRPQTRGARAIIVNPEGEILLVRHTYGKGWYLPGGRVKRSENDISALCREVKEETGIEFHRPSKMLGTYLNQQEYKKDTIVVFVIEEFRNIGGSDVEVDARKFFAATDLPHDVSPGTRRRIEEWQGKRNITTKW